MDCHDAYGAVADRLGGVEKDRIDRPAANDFGHAIVVQTSECAAPIDFGGDLIEGVEGLRAIASGDDRAAKSRALDEIARRRAGRLHMPSQPQVGW